MISKNGTFNQINITPLTDVFLVLLVVLIIATPTFQRSVLKISPPGYKSCGSSLDPSLVVRINIDSKGSVKINGKTLTDSSSVSIQKELETLKRAGKNSDLQVKICPQPDTTQQKLVNALDAACGAGIKQVNIE